MVLPIAVGAGLAGAGLAGSLLNQKNATAPDISGLLNTINSGAQRQTQIATNLPGQLQPLGTQYQTSVTGAENTATNAANAQAQNFLAQLGNNQTLSGQDVTKLLTSQAYQNVPQAEEAARESAAASGGLNRGAAAELTAQPALQAAQNVSTGLTQLDLQQQQQKAAALNTINNMSDQLIQDKLGIDKDTATALYNSGRQDLINEANSLLGISQNQTNELLGAQQFGLTGQIAANAANQAAAQAPFNELTGLGTTLATASALGPGAAALPALTSPTPPPPITTGTTTTPTAGLGTVNNPLLSTILGGQNNPPPPGYTYDQYGNLVPVNG